MHLGVLTLSNLEEAGFISPEDETPSEGVIVRVTSDEHNKAYNEVMWASSVNNEDGRFCMLMHAMLYDKATAKEMGRPAEVAQVFMNKEKASMILDTIRHAYPELLAEMEDIPVGGLGIGVDVDLDDGVDLFAEDEDEDEDEDEAKNVEDVCDERHYSGDAEHCSACGDPLDPFADLVGPTKEEAPINLSADQLIDAHLLVKKELQGVTKSESEIKAIKIAEPHQFLFLTVPRPQELAITFDELDIVHQVKEAVNPPHILKEDAAKLLLGALYEAFPNLKEGA